ncbi:Leucine-rich repeat, cysteine-containing subtype [Corchorus olitorius]|uniref:Leucine-rich repeat, cysteine-containing subtype n=1 Tax=Corchorus olitorius TaxID=93759 RepID=A0A1R3H4F7_9ROSI|nr:Leucine-rich repeat, cysteine-containing subtype [Corchorus olitorius]
MSKKTTGDGADLVSDCLQLVFKYLNNDDLEAVSLVCKNFLANSNLVKEHLKVRNPNVSMLSQHIKRFKNLKKIDLRSFMGDLSEAIGEIARSELSLENLLICPESAFEIENNLKDLGSNPNPKMKDLKALFCTQEESLQNNDFMAIANSFPNLEELDVGETSSARKGRVQIEISLDTGIEYLASKLKFLRKLIIRGEHNYNYSDRSIVALSLNCVFLKDVTVSGSKVTESGIGQLIRNRPNLESLCIEFITSNQSSPITIENSISHAKSLTCLTFVGMGVSDMLLKEIGKLRLKELKLDSCRGFTVSGLCMVVSKYLSKLAIAESDIDDEEMELVLKGGDVSNLSCIEIDGSQLTSSTLFLLSATCPSLETVKLVYPNWDHEEIDNIPECKNHNIQKLSLALTFISDESLERFGLISPNLKVVELTSCFQLTSKGIEAVLKNCKFIKKLLLSRWRSTKIIEADSELTELDLEVLKLSYSIIDDEGLELIGSKCPQLVDLDLSHCQSVTMKSIVKILPSMKKLKRLNLRDSGMVNSNLFLEWLYYFNGLPSLKQITLPQMTNPTRKQRAVFMKRGCLLSNV